MFYLGKAPPLRTGAGKGGSRRGEKEGRGGREGVGPRRRGSAAAWARGGLGNIEWSPYLPILTDDYAERLYRLPWRVLQNTKNSAENDFSPQVGFFIEVRHTSIYVARPG